LGATAAAQLHGGAGPLLGWRYHLLQQHQEDEARRDSEAGRHAGDGGFVGISPVLVHLLLLVKHLGNEAIALHLVACLGGTVNERLPELLEQSLLLSRKRAGERLRDLTDRLRRTQHARGRHDGILLCG
jgi:hypothetical protein